MIEIKLMWVFTGLHTLLAGISLLAPPIERWFLGFFSKPRLARAAGCMVLCLGLVAFFSGDDTSQQVFVQGMGILYVVVGGLCLVMPDAAAVAAEARTDARFVWRLLTALLLLALAYLFYRATLPIPEMPEPD